MGSGLALAIKSGFGLSGMSLGAALWLEPFTVSFEPDFRDSDGFEPPVSGFVISKSISEEVARLSSLLKLVFGARIGRMVAFLCRTNGLGMRWDFGPNAVFPVSPGRAEAETEGLSGLMSDWPISLVDASTHAAMATHCT